MKRPWMWIAVGFVLGEVCGFTFGHIIAIAILIIIAMACFAIYFRKLEYRKYVVYMLVIILPALIGSSRLSMADAKSREELRLDEYADKGQSTSYITSIDSIIDGSKYSALYCGKLIVYIENEKSLDVAAGNKIKVLGKISKISKATNPGQFDYSLYYKAKSKTHICFADSIEIIDNKKSILKEGLRWLRLKAGFAIDSIYDEADAGFLKAALLGDKSEISDDDYSLYKDNGIAHLLAISGLHVGIVGLGLYNLLRKKLHVGFLGSGVVAGIFLLMYGMMTGFSVSISRAVAMLLLYFIAEYIGRSSDMCNTVGLVAVFVLFVSPYELTQCGFLLSFLAVLSIGGPAQSIIKIYNKKNNLVSSIIISLSVQLVTLPVIAYYFYSVPLYATILNLIVIPLMSLVVYSGILVIFLYYVSVALSYMSAGAAHYIILIYRMLCELFGKLPNSNIIIGRPSLLRLLCYIISLSISYLLLTGKCFFTGEGVNKNRTFHAIKRYRIYIAMIFTLLGLCSLTPICDSNTETCYLDVGQGDGIYIREGSTHMLIDGGSSSNKSVGKDILEPFLKSSAVASLDFVFVTHADMDHTNGIEYILEKADYIKIKKLVLPYQASDDEKYDDLKRLAIKRGTEIFYMKAGDVIRLKRGSISCLSPDRNDTPEDINEQSLVLLYKRDNYKAVFMGDASTACEERILDNYMDSIKNVTVLKAGHHGSKTASSDSYIKNTNPSIAVLSYGEGNRYGHPHKEVLDVLNEYDADIKATANMGAISIITDGEGIKIDSFLDDD